MPDPTQDTCSVTIYANCDITEERNCRVDNIEDYLDSLDNNNKKSYPLVQTFNTKLDLVTEVVLTLNEYSSETTGWNYMKVYISPNNYYYFITDVKRRGNGQARFYLKLDTVNTIWWALKLQPTTHVMREHKDRFIKRNDYDEEIGGKLYRIVDREPESITPELFRSSAETTIYDSDANFDWFLVYKTEQELGESDNNPLHCYLCASQDLELGMNVLTKTIDAEDFPEEYYLYFRNNAYNYGTIVVGGNTINVTSDYYYVIQNDGVSIQVTIFLANGNYSSSASGPSITFTGVFERIYKSNSVIFDTSKIDTTAFGVIVEMNDQYFVGVGNNATIKSIDSIDRTDSKIMKIIALPYCPVNYTYDEDEDKYTFNMSNWEYSYGMQMLMLKDLSIDFIHQIYTKANSDMYAYAIPIPASKVYLKSVDYESKLYNSSFYQVKYFYDTFNKVLPYEDYDHDLDNDVYTTISLKVTNQIQSRFIFNFNVDDYSYKSLGDYPQYMIVQRNNEITLYNNDYLNYMRSGYNYDVKSKDRSLLFGGAALGIGIGGTLAASTGIGVGVAVGILASSLSFVNNAISQDAQIKQKMNQLQQQSGTVSVNDDFNLLKYYSGNRLKYIEYSVSDITKNALHNYFHLCGYSTNYYGVPNLNTRYWFNFVQMTPVFKVEDSNGIQEEIKFTEEFRKDIIQRCEAGLTIFHMNKVGTTNRWDFEQKYENWEEWIVNGIS